MNLKLFRLVVTINLVAMFSACTNLPYYAQAISGHLTVMHRARPIDSVLTNSEIDSKVKNALHKVVQIRAFASKELKLPDNLSYTRYANLERPFVVWNVFAAPEFSIKPKKWCFLQVGCVNYRGFFSQQHAEDYAEKLRGEGYDVHIGGVRAYSTLGWFSDPVLNTFIGYSEINLARLIFHELAHQVVFVAGDSMFNESFATAVEHEGIKRWFVANGTIFQQEDLTSRLEREKVFVDLIRKYRDQLQELFDLNLGDEEARVRKQLIFYELRAEFAGLKMMLPGLRNYDAWFVQPLNNALLATVSLYTELVPSFQFMLSQCNGGMECFFERVKRVSKLSKEERSLVMREAGKSYSILANDKSLVGDKEDTVFE